MAQSGSTNNMALRSSSATDLFKEDTIPRDSFLPMQVNVGPEACGFESQVVGSPPGRWMLPSTLPRVHLLRTILLNSDCQNEQCRRAREAARLYLMLFIPKRYECTVFRRKRSTCTPVNFASPDRDDQHEMFSARDRNMAPSSRFTSPTWVVCSIVHLTISRRHITLMITAALLLGACRRIAESAGTNNRSGEWHEFEGTWTAAGTRQEWAIIGNLQLAATVGRWCSQGLCARRSDFAPMRSC